ncbi:hypothetical protein [uncultured Paludibaculum sp.]|uniref:hypothetical protein n=1 Tax=uncultured Paludibaculum sp. TaxID=1765020 RepID=UPI002AAB40D1|nr:hypothetical protein [uncultured Paludibaculum sp.]
MVGQESLGGRGPLGEPERRLIDAAIGFQTSGVEGCALDGMPAEFVRLEHATVDEQQAGAAVEAGGGAAEGVVEPFGREARRQLEREGARRRFAGVLGGGSLACLGARSGGLLRVGPIGGEAASRDGDLGGAAGHG